MSCPRPWLAALLLACSFDASGLGEVPSSVADGSSTGGSAGTGSTAGPATTGTPPDPSTSTAGLTGTGTGDDSTSTGPIDPGTTTGTGDLTTTADASTSSTTAPDDTTTTTTGTTTTTTTTGQQPCDTFEKHIELVADAVVIPPMVTTVSQVGEGIVAYSTQAESGLVTFTFDVACPGQYAVWGRVLDAEPGVNNYDPDSFYPRLDLAPEVGWYYGCQTGGLSDGYHWLRVRAGIEGAPCQDGVPWTLDLAPGTHAITLRNREQMDGGGNVAAVARILVTRDLNYVPLQGD